jgi:RNA recognition motif-containing protein
VDFAKPKKKQPTVPSAPVEKNVVFVGNLMWRVRSRHLRELFASTPGVQSVEVIFHTTTPRRSAGYAFVSFSSKEEAEAAIATFNGQVNILKCCMYNIIRMLFVLFSNLIAWKCSHTTQAHTCMFC